MGVFLGDGFDVGALLADDVADLVGEFFVGLDDLAAGAGAHVAHAAEAEGEEAEDGDLADEGFGGGDADLGTGVHVDAAVALAGDGGADVITNAEGAEAFAAGFAHGTEGVCGFATLADGEEEGVAVEGAILKAELAGEVCFCGDEGVVFEHVLADHAGMEGGAAAEDDDALDVTELAGGHIETA